MIVSRTVVVGQGYTRPPCEDLHLDLYQKLFPPRTSTLWKALGSDCMVFATPLLAEVPGISAYGLGTSDSQTVGHVYSTRLL